MTDDGSFLQAIVAQPQDLALRRIYADWLEEQGDAVSLSRAAYLRTECELDHLPPKSTKRARLRTQLAALRKRVGDAWWRELDYGKVEYCVQFEYACPQRWDTLQPTEDPEVRHCTHCQQNVYYCANERGALDRADAGQCVAVDARAFRVGLELMRPPEGRLVRVTPRVQQRIPLGERGAPRRRTRQNRQHRRTAGP